MSTFFLPDSQLLTLIRGISEVRKNRMNRNRVAYLKQDPDSGHHLWQVPTNPTDGGFERLIEEEWQISTPSITNNQDILLFTAVNPTENAILYSYRLANDETTPLHNKTYHSLELYGRPHPIFENTVVFHAFLRQVGGLYIFDGNDVTLLTPDPNDNVEILPSSWTRDGEHLYCTFSPLDTQADTEIYRLDISRESDGDLQVINQELIIQRRGLNYPFPDNDNQLLLYQMANNDTSALYYLDLQSGSSRYLTSGMTPTLDPSSSNVYYLNDRALYVLRNWDTLVNVDIEPLLLWNIPIGTKGIGYWHSMAVSDNTIFVVLEGRSTDQLVIQITSH